MDGDMWTTMPETNNNDTQGWGSDDDQPQRLLRKKPPIGVGDNGFSFDGPFGGNVNGVGGNGEPPRRMREMPPKKDEELKDDWGDAINSVIEKKQQPIQGDRHRRDRGGCDFGEIGDRRNKERNDRYGGDRDDGRRRRENHDENKFPPRRREDDRGERGGDRDRKPRSYDHGERRDRGGDRGGDREDRPKRVQYIPPNLRDDETPNTRNLTKTGKNFSKYESAEVIISGPGCEKVTKLNIFGDAGLDDRLAARLADLEYLKPTPIQKSAIPAILQGRDLMACAQTGSGKTAAFLLPIIHDLMRQNCKAKTAERQLPEVLIVSPTRELAIQIYDQARIFAKGSSIVPQCCYGGTDVRFLRQRISGQGCNILIGTPGRINDFLEREFLGLDNIQYFVLDEADRMLDMGFGPVMHQLADGFSMPRPGERKTLMFSATFPQHIQKFAADFLAEEYLFIKVGIVGGACSDVTQRILMIGSDEAAKSGKLEDIIKTVADTRQRTLVFVETKVKADFIACMLSQTKVPTTSIHGGRLQPERETALADFRCGKCPILVATSVAARGLDIPEVEHVVNYELPREIEEYVHRIGRTGRCGNVGISTSFYDPSKDAHLSPALIKTLSDANQEVPDWLVNEAELAQKSGELYQNRYRGETRDHRSFRSSGGGGMKPREMKPVQHEPTMINNVISEELLWGKPTRTERTERNRDPNQPQSDDGWGPN